MVENALTQNNDNVQAIVVSNDGMAGGVVSALEKGIDRKSSGHRTRRAKRRFAAHRRRQANDDRLQTDYSACQCCRRSRDKIGEKRTFDRSANRLETTISSKDIPAILLEVIGG
jgi:hypothetical protein